MSNKDITYCNGDGCLLRNMCRRYVEGQRIKANRHGDTNQYIHLLWPAYRLR